jgi:hypothetical protein
LQKPKGYFAIEKLVEKIGSKLLRNSWHTHFINMRITEESEVSCGKVKTFSAGKETDFHFRSLFETGYDLEYIGGLRPNHGIALVDCMPDEKPVKQTPKKFIPPVKKTLKKFIPPVERVRDESSKFDVVKKRRAMEAPENAHEENAPEALAAFKAFEESVLPALEKISMDEKEFRRLELMEFEDSVARGILPPSTGGVYFAWSPCLNCMKIGATRREDPQIRLHELSMQVPSPYTLAGWLPTPTPFRLEAAVHQHFISKRINFRGAGAGTEFFHVSVAEAAAYVVV